MSVGFLKEQSIQIARGLVKSVYSVNKFGYNSDVPSNAFETVWDGSNLYTYVSTPGVATVTSTDTSSDNNGTVQVFGLDDNYNLVDETLTIGGAAGSVTFKRVFRAVMLTANTGDTNVGTISVTVDSIAVAKIVPGKAQTLMAIYTIPANKRGYLVQLDVGSSKDLENEIQLVVRNGVSGNVWQTKSFITTRGGFLEKNYALPIEILEKHDIEVRAKASATSAVSAGFELMVVDHPIG